MNIIERINKEKKYLISLGEKRSYLTQEKDTYIKEEKYLTQEINQNYKEKFEITTEINHYHDVKKIITFQTFLKLLVALILTILVIKYIPIIYAHLFQNLLLIPLYFYLAYTWVKNTQQEFAFQNTFDIKKKELTIANLNDKITKLEEKKNKLKDKIKNLTNLLDEIVKEENNHKTYLHILEEILSKYYYESLESY